VRTAGTLTLFLLTVAAVAMDSSAATWGRASRRALSLATMLVVSAAARRGVDLRGTDVIRVAVWLVPAMLGAGVGGEEDRLRRSRNGFWVLLSAPVLVAAAPPAGDARHGEELFQSRCALCHLVEAAAGSGQGPNLAGVVGRKAAATAFGYSPALSRWAQRWTPERLDAYLADPPALVPGTTMVVRIPDAQERRDLVAYLATLRAAAPRPSGAVKPRPTDATATQPLDGGAAGAASCSSGGEGRVLRGRAAFGDWRSDAPGVRRLIQVEDLPAPFVTPSAGNSPRVVRRPSGVVPRAPPGFRVDLFADGLENPRIVRIAPNGDVFVAETAQGRVRLLRAADDSPRAEQRWIFADGLDAPFGIAFYPPGADPSWVYVAENDRVVRFPYRSGDTRARGQAEVIVPHLSPTTAGHTTRDVTFSRDGRRMFVSVGSQSNVAERMSRKSPDEAKAWEASHGLGAAWGPEERRAAVLVFEPTGGPGRIFATGLRNCVGLAVHPSSGDLWCSTNERDGMGDDLVPDHVTRVREGAWYGWPWYWLGNHEEPRLPRARPDLAGKATVPDVLLQSHSASLGMTFYGGATFPPEYRGDGFAAEHGSWNRARRTGYKVVRIPLRAGVPTGEYEDFLTGFVVDDQSVWGRPVGVAVAHDGALLVSEDAGETVWRVSAR
jgi:glucose/arabinose dehydrogenase/cytochrome c2